MLIKQSLDEGNSVELLKKMQKEKIKIKIEKVVRIEEITAIPKVKRDQNKIDKIASPKGGSEKVTKVVKVVSPK